MQGLSEPCSSGYMASDVPTEKPGFPGLRHVAGLRDLRLLFREVLAGGGGGGIGHDPGRVLRLGRARVLLAQERAEHLGVDADLLGEDLGRERCRHGTYLLEASASLIDAIVLSYMTRRPIARGHVAHLQTLYNWVLNDGAHQCLRRRTNVGTPPAAPPKDQLTLGVRCARAKRAGCRNLRTLEAAYSA